MNFLRLTAGNHNLAAYIGDWSRLNIDRVTIVTDSTDGAVNIALPAITNLRLFQKLRITIDDTAGTAATNNTVITRGGTDTINANATTYTMSTNNQKVVFEITNNDPDVTAGRWLALTNVVGAGGGSVSDFSAGNLTPLFETSVATSTSTPALSFAAFAVEASKVYASPEEGDAPGVPSFRKLIASDVTLTATGLIDFPSIPGHSIVERPIAVPGAVVYDSVAIGLPANPVDGVIFTGYVSEADVVIIRAANISAGPIDPGEVKYRATVFHYNTA